MSIVTPKTDFLQLLSDIRVVLAHMDCPELLERVRVAMVELEEL